MTVTALDMTAHEQMIALKDAHIALLRDQVAMLQAKADQGDRWKARYRTLKAERPPMETPFLPVVVSQELALYCADKTPQENQMAYAAARKEWAELKRKGMDNEDEAKRLASRIATPSLGMTDEYGNVVGLSV